MFPKDSEQLNQKRDTLSSSQGGEGTTDLEVQCGSNLKASCNGEQDSAKCFCKSFFDLWSIYPKPSMGIVS